MILHIAICSDSGLSCHLPRLLWSISRHHQPGEIHLHFGNADKNAASFRPFIENLCKQYQLSLSWYDLLSHLETHIGTLNQAGRCVPLPPGTYARWFFPDLLDPAINRLLYLDADTLVTGSLLPLLNINLQGAPFAAALDWFHADEFGARFASSARSNCLIRLRAEDFTGYVNAGVLLIDPAVWRGMGLASILLETRRRALSDCIELTHEDQDVINLWARGKMPRLDPVFNAMAFSFWSNRSDCNFPNEPPARFHLVHYAGIKPWTEDRWRNLPLCFALPLIEAWAATEPCPETARTFALRSTILQKVAEQTSWADAQHFTQIADPLIAAANHKLTSLDAITEAPLAACATLLGLPAGTTSHTLPALIALELNIADHFKQYHRFRALRKSWRLVRRTKPATPYRTAFLKKIIKRFFLGPDGAKHGA